MSREFWSQNVGCGLCLLRIEMLWKLGKQEKQHRRKYYINQYFKENIRSVLNIEFDFLLVFVCHQINIHLPDL